MRTPPDPTAPVGALLGHLIQVLRSTPGQQKRIREAADLLAARIAQGPAVIEAGIENSWAIDGDPLKERLQLRRVDSIAIARGTGREELLALARALADDRAPIPSSERVRVTLVPEAPLGRALAEEAVGVIEPAVPGPLRARPADQLSTVIDGILKELDLAIQRKEWHVVLHDAQAALRLMPGLGEEVRRSYSIAIRRLLSRTVLEKLIEQAYHVPEEQARTAEVLRAGGMPAAEQMLELLRRSGGTGPRAFLVDALGGMPEVFAMAVPLARSTRSAEAWLGIELLGRLGLPGAIPVLAERVKDPDERVRHAAIDALGQFREKGVVEPLRLAMSHLSPSTRARAGRVLAQRGSGGIAMPLFAAFETEKDPDAAQELLDTLVELDSPEVAAALARVALEKRGFLSFGSTDVRRQLAIVRTLGARNTPVARQALTRIASEARGEVQEAAQAALGHGR